MDRNAGVVRVSIKSPIKTNTYIKADEARYALNGVLADANFIGTWFTLSTQLRTPARLRLPKRVACQLRTSLSSNQFHISATSSTA